MNYFLVSSGLLSPEHRQRIGIAVWEFTWLIDRQFKPKNGGPDTGVVMNGEAITAGRIAADLGLSIRTVQRNLETLEAEGYVRTEYIPGVGQRFFIANPKRWKFLTLDTNVMGTLDTNVDTPRQKCLAPLDRSVYHNKEARLSRLKDSISSKPNGSDLMFSQVQVLFHYFIERTGKNPKLYKLSPTRKEKGLARLRFCYGLAGEPKAEKAVELFKVAIERFSASRFHNGENPQGKKYLEWELLCRNDDKFGYWLDDQNFVGGKANG